MGETLMSSVLFSCAEAKDAILQSLSNEYTHDVVVLPKVYESFCRFI